jgi:hypothetical protein
MAILSHRVDCGMTWPRGKARPTGPLALGGAGAYDWLPRSPTEGFRGCRVPQE